MGHLLLGSKNFNNKFFNQLFKANTNYILVFSSRKMKGAKRSDQLPEEFYLLLPENGGNPVARFSDHPGAEIPQLMLPKDSEIIIPDSDFSSEDFLRQVNSGLHQERFWYLLVGIIVGVILANLVSFLVELHSRKMKKILTKTRLDGVIIQGSRKSDSIFS